MGVTRKESSHRYLEDKQRMQDWTDWSLKALSSSALLVFTAQHNIVPRTGHRASDSN